jgi:hypothetical protein
MSTIRPLALMVILIGLQHGAGLAQVPEDATLTVDVFDNPTRVLTLGLEEREPGEPVLVLQAGAEAIDWFQRLPPEERGLPADPGVPTAVVLGTLVTEPPPGAPSFMDGAFLGAMMEQRVRRFSDWIQDRKPR